MKWVVVGEGRFCDFFSVGLNDCERCDCFDVFFDRCDFRGGYCDVGGCEWEICRSEEYSCVDERWLKKDERECCSDDSYCGGCDKFFGCDYDYFRGLCECSGYESKIWVVVIEVDLLGVNVGVFGVSMDL